MYRDCAKIIIASNGCGFSVIRQSNPAELAQSQSNIALAPRPIRNPLCRWKLAGYLIGRATFKGVVG